METFDVIVIGGGPAGMMAAGRAGECGRRTLLVEKNRTVGAKLNLTGGGRCNITNAEFDNRTFLSFFGDARKFLYSPFSQFAVQETFDFFEGRGLPLIVEDRKRAFPASQQATDVTRVLTEYLREHRVELRTGMEVKRLIAESGRIQRIETNQGVFAAECFVLATGGASYRETGSTGDGMNWLRDIGHTVHPATPDIVPLRVAEQWVKDLSGTNLDPMKITFRAVNGEGFSREGRLLFTHFGLSGPLILNSANEVKKLLKKGPVATSIDLFPGMEPHQVDRIVLEIFGDNKNKIVRNVIKLMIPVGMARGIEGHLSVDLLEKKVNAVTLDDRKQLVQRLKDLPLTVTGTMGYDWAVVCDGGIDLAEIDTRTMRSRKYDNLFVAGDLLHVSRPSGGYSLQLCWTTGWIAGGNA
ncbi:MAG: aminoacetone oxidase family FAD-binding enzyme [Kiritimatiellaceae bacterium]|nr:aminoacetone oxidase family FAD-binding enzyme [Kiritimatiellaceae bacterium]